MSILSWGKPIIEIAPLVNGTIPDDPQWAEVGVVQRNTARLEANEGEIYEAMDEGHNRIDVRVSKTLFDFTFTLFHIKGMALPLADVDGYVPTYYALRLTPEDSDNTGFILPKCHVSVRHIWSSDIGGLSVYVFRALKPASGEAMQDFEARQLLLDESGRFVLTEDGKYADVIKRYNF